MFLLCLLCRSDAEQMLIPADQQPAADRHRRGDDSLAHIIVIGQQLETFVAHSANENDSVLARTIQLVARQDGRAIELIAILRQVGRP